MACVVVYPPQRTLQKANLMFNPIRWIVRGAQIILLGFIIAFAKEIFEIWPTASQWSLQQWARPAAILAALVILLIMTNNRRQSMYAALIAYAGMAALVLDHERVLSLLGV